MNTHLGGPFFHGGASSQKSRSFPKHSKPTLIVAPAAQRLLEQPPINYAALALLQSWATEGDEQEQRDTWEYLKKVLDEDRLSDRKLFP
jgi:hypothetical protein